ncbi:hypothetical protein BDD12DRAFT_823308 [Trichophaea hybrida]|nr:hypothetical protein BDD12DRAFT_823308 [Trichophaea hybrida]
MLSPEPPTTTISQPCTDCTPRSNFPTYNPSHLGRSGYEIFCIFCDRTVSFDYRLFPLDQQQHYGWPLEEYPGRSLSSKNGRVSIREE